MDEVTQKPKKAKAGEGLPAEVRTAIEASMVMPRDSDRVYVAIAGKSLRGAFQWSVEEGTARVSAYWPDLKPEQVERAVSFIGAMVAARVQAEKSISRKSWVFDY